MKPPTGWRVEMLGLISAVRFTSPAGSELLWCDGEWRMGNGRVMTVAVGVPHASTMAQARQVGCAFLKEAS
jgi:hypothetical protein